MAKQETAKSLKEISSLLITPAANPEPEVSEQDMTEDELTLTEGIDEDQEVDPEDTEDDTEDDSQGDDDTEEPLEEGEDEEDAGDDDADDQLDDDGFVVINDDDMIEVKIDGEVVLRSISDAKKALSGEGAIEKRLKEATELRKQSQADHTMLLEQFSVAHKALMTTVEGMESIVFKPTVPKPDPQLRTTDPQKYLLQVDAYEADQRRVEEGKSAIKQLVQEQQKALQKDIATYRQGQTKALIEAIPELGDKEQAPKLLQSMSKVAMEVYGYSAEEIQQASDHRLYRMIYDLSKLHEARTPSNRKANTVKNLEGQKNKAPRKLRSGATALKKRARKQADETKRLTDTARQTGKVKDVSATLIKRG